MFLEIPICLLIMEDKMGSILYNTTSMKHRFYRIIGITGKKDTVIKYIWNI